MKLKLSRNLTLRFIYCLDNLLPPVVRDSRIFMRPLFRFVFGDKADIFLSFKENAFSMDNETYKNIYTSVQSVTIARETDLNTGCLEEIQKRVIGNYVLDVGCGNGFLAKKLSHRYEMSATDLNIDESLIVNNRHINFLEANIEHLPFSDKKFDTVICTHTLEHVLHFKEAVRELRRVTRSRLIIVVPKQRSYKYTFDLHLHFFPYLYSFLGVMEKSGNDVICKEIGGDIYYEENLMGVSVD